MNISLALSRLFPRIARRLPTSGPVLPFDPSLAKTAVSHKRSRTAILAGTALIMLFIGAFTAVTLREIDDAARRRAEEHLDQLNKVVTHQFVTLLAGIEQSMRNAEHEIRVSGEPQKLNELARDGRVSLHLLGDLVFVDAAGDVQASARPADLITLNRAERDQFASVGGGTQRGSRVGQPVRDRRSGRELIPVSHAVRDNQDQLMGVLVALIDLDALQTTWSHMGLTPQDYIELIGEGGKSLFEWPRGTKRGKTRTTRSAVGAWPLVVETSLDLATVAADGAEAKRTVLLVAACGAAMILAFCLLLINRQAAADAVERRLLGTIEAIPIEYMEYDRDNRLVLINQAARLSQGWTNAAVGKTEIELLELSAQQLRRLHPDQNWDAWMAGRIAQTSRFGSYELTRPSGLSGRFFVKRMPGGGKVVLRVDVTEAKRHEAELEASRQRYQRLFDAIPYPMIVLTRSSRRFLMANNAAIEQYGWSMDELLGKSLDEFYPPEDLETIKKIRTTTGPTLGRIITGFHHFKKDGSLIDVEMQALPIELNSEPALVLVCVDVTDRLATERARAAAEDQLRQSQKMEAVGQLTGGIAHDFNNLLTVILANADALQEEGLDIGQLPQRVRSINEAVTRASDLTRQLLAFSRKQELAPKPTNLNDLVESTGKMLRRALGEHIEINSKLAGGLWTVKVDRTQLETALVNLSVNARDAMPDGGKLLIATANVSLSSADLRGTPDVAAGDYVLLSVTDTGCGIPKDKLARVFEPFFTTKEAGKGTGLGLAMVYGFIKQSNGHIQVESEVGRGTTFKLYLPRSQAAVQTPAVERKEELPGGSERILVVEDEAEVRNAVVSQLQKLGYQVTSAGDGQTGLAALAATQAPFDLVLTDVVMPGGVNGKALADEVAQRSPATLTVFMSGYTDNHLAEGAPLLKKPFRKRELAHFVRKALGGPQPTKRAA